MYNKLIVAVQNDSISLNPNFFSCVPNLSNDWALRPVITRWSASTIGKIVKIFAPKGSGKEI